MATLSDELLGNPNEYYKNDLESSGSYFGVYKPERDAAGNLTATGLDVSRRRYRSMGDAAAQREAYRANFAGADQDLARAAAARAQQNQAVAALGQAAAGNAPSGAAIRGGMVGEQSLLAGLSQSAGTRSSMAQIAAARQAMQGMQAAQLAGQDQALGARAGELAQARGSYMQGASAMRAGDYDAQGIYQQRAEAQAQAEMAQRELNQQAQLGYEKMGYDDTVAESNRRIREHQMAAGQYTFNSGIGQRQADRTDALIGAGANAVGSGISAGIRSDERVKSDVLPLMDSPDGRPLRMTPEGRAYYGDTPATRLQDLTGGASLTGGGAPARLQAPAAESKAKSNGRRMSMAELAAWADRETAATRAAEGASLKAGPAVRRLAEGTPATGYNTELTRGAEQAFQRWHDRTSPWDTGEDYDLRGAFAEGLDRDGRGHLPDTYKKPNHETFSDESQYAKYAPDEAGSWEGEKYTPKGPPAWLRREMRSRDMGSALAAGLAPYEYSYKPGFAEEEGQGPSERNVGPMAQDMASNPITASAVKRGPDGLLYIDGAKAQKLSLGAIGYLAAKVKQQEQELAKLKGSR